MPQGYFFTKAKRYRKYGIFLYDTKKGKEHVVFQMTLKGKKK
jgi:hypothetical protein